DERCAIPRLLSSPFRMSHGQDIPSCGNPAWDLDSHPKSHLFSTTERPMTATAETELLIRTRRDLHRHPELAFQEHRTAAIVAGRLRAVGYEVRTGVGETGVVGTLR